MVILLICDVSVSWKRSNNQTVSPNGDFIRNYQMVEHKIKTITWKKSEEMMQPLGERCDLGNFIINPSPELQPFWVGFPYCSTITPVLGEVTSGDRSVLMTPCQKLIHPKVTVSPRSKWQCRHIGPWAKLPIWVQLWITDMDRIIMFIETLLISHFRAHKTGIICKNSSVGDMWIWKSNL